MTRRWCSSGEAETRRAVVARGATGFVGAHLLQNLLTDTQAAVYCLVRAGDAAEGLARLRAAAEWYRLSEEVGMSRVVVVPGDLVLPRMGLSTQDYDRLAESVDTIVHNAALVNLVTEKGMLQFARAGECLR